MDWNWIIAAGGLALGLFGWTIYWLGLQATGAAIGLMSGAGIGAIVALLLRLPQDGLLVALGLGGAIGLVLGVFLSRALHKGMFFVLGAVAGSLTAHAGVVLAERAGWGQPLPWAGVGLQLISCIAGGILAVVFSKYIISFITAAAGAWLISHAFGYQYAELVAVPSFLLFFFVQSHFLRRLPHPSEHWEDSS